MFHFQNIDLFRVRLILAVALLSLAVVSYEIQLIHFFTIVQWHHFAFMIISIALLGFGASGTLISIFRTWLLKREDFLLPFFMICSGLLMSFVIRLSRTDFFIFDSYTLFVEHSQFWKLLATYLLCFLPFFSAALAIGMIFVSKVSHIGTYYFADLSGAGFGGLLAIVLFWWFSPQEIPALIALLPILAGSIIIGKKYRVVLFTFVVLSLVTVVYHFNRPFNLEPSQFKGISYALNLPDARIEHEQSSPYGLLQVVSSPVLRYAPGLSLTYTGKVPASDIIFNNGDWFAAIPQWSKKDTTHLLDYTTMALPYALRKPRSVLLLDAGAGLELSHALVKGVSQVTAVEPNAMVISLLKNDYAGATDSLFYHRNVELYALKSRAFLSRTTNSYDLIQLPLLGAFGGTAGLNALHENHLLTKEAFTYMWSKLTPDGLIAISSWIDMPPRISLKTAATISEYLADLKIKNPPNHVAAIRSWGTITFVVKRSPLDTGDIANIRSFCERYNFDPVLLPGVPAGEGVPYNSMEDETFFSTLEGMFGPERKAIRDAYDFNIRPATDNKPLFF